MGVLPDFFFLKKEHCSRSLGQQIKGRIQCTSVCCNVSYLFNSQLQLTNMTIHSKISTLAVFAPRQILVLLQFFLSSAASDPLCKCRSCWPLQSGELITTHFVHFSAWPKAFMSFAGFGSEKALLRYGTVSYAAYGEQLARSGLPHAYGRVGGGAAALLIAQPGCLGMVHLRLRQAAGASRRSRLGKLGHLGSGGQMWRLGTGGMDMLGVEAGHAGSAATTHDMGQSARSSSQQACSSQLSSGWPFGIGLDSLSFGSGCGRRRGAHIIVRLSYLSGVYLPAKKRCPHQSGHSDTVLCRGCGLQQQEAQQRPHTFSISNLWSFLLELCFSFPAK